MNGVSVLGHADAAIRLRVYAHYLPDDKQKDVDLLDTQPNAARAAVGVRGRSGRGSSVVCGEW
jgi:hypothetical protein